MQKILNLWVTAIFYVFSDLHGDDSLYLVFPEECQGSPKRYTQGPYDSSLAFCLGVSIKLSAKDANVLVRYANQYDSSVFVRRIYFGKEYLGLTPNCDYLLNLKRDDILKGLNEEGDIRANLMGILLACINHDIVLPCWILQEFPLVDVLANAFGAEAEKHWFLLSRLKLLELRMGKLQISCKLKGKVYFHFCHPDFIFINQERQTEETFQPDLLNSIRNIINTCDTFGEAPKVSSRLFQDLSKGKIGRYRSIGSFCLGKKNQKADNAKPKYVSKLCN